MRRLGSRSDVGWFATDVAGPRERDGLVDVRLGPREHQALQSGGAVALEAERHSAPAGRGVLAGGASLPEGRDPDTGEELVSVPEDPLSSIAKLMTGQSTL